MPARGRADWSWNTTARYTNATSRKCSPTWRAAQRCADSGSPLGASRAVWAVPSHAPQFDADSPRVGRIAFRLERHRFSAPRRCAARTTLRRRRTQNPGSACPACRRQRRRESGHRRNEDQRMSESSREQVTARDESAPSKILPLTCITLLLLLLPLVGVSYHALVAFERKLLPEIEKGFARGLVHDRQHPAGAGFRYPVHQVGRHDGVFRRQAGSGARHRLCRGHRQRRPGVVSARRARRLAAFALGRRHARRGDGASGGRPDRPAPPVTGSAGGAFSEHAPSHPRRPAPPTGTTITGSRCRFAPTALSSVRCIWASTRASSSVRSRRSGSISPSSCWWRP